MQIFRNDGVWVHGMNTYRHDCDLGKFQGRGCIKLHYPRLNLLEGDYYVSVGAWPDEYTSFISDVAYDVAEMAFIFSVFQQRHHGAGIVRMEAKWEFTPPGAPPLAAMSKQLIDDGEIPKRPRTAQDFHEPSAEPADEKQSDEPAAKSADA